MKPKRPKISPSQLNFYTQPVEDIYQTLEEQIFEMIAKRLKTSKDLSRDNVFEWQIDKLNQVRGLNQETIKLLSQATGVAEREITRAIKNIGYDTIKSVDSELSRVYDTLSMPSHIDIILETYVQQTFREFDNFVNQTLIDTNYGRGTVSKMYRKIIEETTGKVLAGTTTTHKAMVESVIKWSRRGIDTRFIDKGGNVWTLEHYARTVIRTTANRTYNELRMSRMGEYGVGLVLVSSLPDPREICSHIQGKVASIYEPALNDSKYPSIYDFGYGTPGGLRGVNCRHQFFPFVEGLNENNQIQYTDKEMTENREDRQKQRYHERQIRDAKRSLRLAEIMGDEDSILRYKKLLRNRQAAMRNFINESGRTRQYDREQIYS